MHIAICDDDAQELARLSGVLECYRKKTKKAFFYQSYSDGVALIDDVREGKYDLLLLDILMPLVNGIQIAEEIRTFNKDIKIVFLTSSKEFALESYSVSALTYLLKPATEDRLFPVLDQFFQASQKLEEKLTVKFKNGVAKLLFDDIAYVEVFNKILLFHMTDNRSREVAAPLVDYEDALLSRPEFIRVHRSFIINLHQVQEIRPADILTYSGRIVPVSRRLYTQVRDAYIEQLFQTKEGI